MKRLILLFAILLNSMTAFADTSENICIFQEGVVIFETDASGVDSICIKDNKVYLYDNNSKLIYQVKTDEIDSIRFLPPVPKAHMEIPRFSSVVVMDVMKCVSAIIAGQERQFVITR